MSVKHFWVLDVQLWESPSSKGKGHVASEGSQPTALSHAGYTEAHLASYIDGQGAHGGIGTNEGILVKYLKGIKVLSSANVTVEVPPELHMKHGQQTRIGSHCAARKPQPRYHN